MRANTIHVAFGFHVNCYHSYRGDTPDAQGFGSDLRIIRGIIGALDALNAEGVPVRGTWDSENFFSLERILPQYAPDILEGMKRRVRERGDENIIMGWSNGALGAMQPDELAASVRLAVTNPAGSGLADLFGGCEMIVRPQEVMFSPSQTRAYNALGVKALCLYNSCVPFDAFGTLVPPLPDEQAFNPLRFEYGGDAITIIPTYSNADVCDAGCLRAWVKDLRDKQARGVIDRDLFLFINMDADAIFWETLDLPLVGHRLANTDGVRGLVREIADLDYVVFDTPGGYLKTHAPVGTVRFTQDTADGNFTGYASWAEKPYNRKIWTAIERSRTAARVKDDPDAFLDRVRLLSTTHFGLATPVLNVRRETAANDLARKLAQASRAPDGPLTLRGGEKRTLHCAQLACAAPALPGVAAKGLKACTVVPVGADSVFALCRSERPADALVLRSKTAADLSAEGDPLSLKSGDARLVFSPDGAVERLTCGGRTVGGLDFLRSYVTYGGKRYDFIRESFAPEAVAGGRCLKLTGRIDLPGAVSPGRFAYRFFTSDAAEGFFAAIDVQYPRTPERDAISTENSALGRYTDDRWQEAVPFGLCPVFTDVSVVKRNFEGDISSFRAASFGEADPRNRTLDSFNNQLTAGLFGLTGDGAGLLAGFARNVLSSMACCPMRLSPDGRVLMDPFGTFDGRQRAHRSRSGGRIPRTYTLIAPQGRSLAPSYNGARERAVLCLLPFTGEEPDKARLDDLLAFADGAFVTGSDPVLSPFDGDNAVVPEADETRPDGRVRSPLLGGLRGNLGKYIVRGARAIAWIVRRQISAR